MLIGNVGAEPEIRYIDAGVCTAQFNLATNTPGYTLQNGTQVPERTEWHRVQLWNKLAEVVEKYVHKGDKLYIEGQLHTRSYTDKKGITRYITEVWADNLEMLTPRLVSQARNAVNNGQTSTSVSEKDQQGVLEGSSQKDFPL